MSEVDTRYSLRCSELCCADVNTATHTPPAGVENPAGIRVMMISEVPPESREDHFDAGPDAFYFRTTAEMFADAGYPIGSMADLQYLGVYLTTAVKCSKTVYTIAPATIKRCAELLKREIDFFPNVKVYMLMGDVAIKAFNHIAKAETGKPAIPNIPTYKIRGNEYYFRGARVLPSYLQTGKSISIEKGKRTVISADIKTAMEIVAAG